MSQAGKGMTKTITQKENHTILVLRILLETLSESNVLEPSFGSQ